MHTHAPLLIHRNQCLCLFRHQLQCKQTKVLIHCHQCQYIHTQASVLIHTQASVLIHTQTPVLMHTQTPVLMHTPAQGSVDTHTSVLMPTHVDAYTYTNRICIPIYNIGLIMRKQGPEVINFFMFNSTEHDISTAQMLENKDFSCFQTKMYL